MDIEIKQILNKIEDNGFEAYIIGGYVRDKLLNISSNDIDIATNALPKDLMNIFSGNATNSIYGAYKIITDKYHFDITTYRKELSYQGRKPDKIEYINNLLQDIQRRDFTINTICMDSEGKIIDLLNGVNDLKNKIIKSVGEPNSKLKEDPLRILRALRLNITLDFKLDKKLLKAIKKNIKLINTLSNMRIREELDRILVSPYALKGLKILNNIGVLKVLKIKYHHLSYVDDLCGMYAQLEVPDSFLFTKEEEKNILKIKNILKSKKINNNTIYQNGLYISLVAGKIMNIEPSKVTTLEKNMPIKNKQDLVLKAEDIMQILQIKPSKVIKLIQDDLIVNILNNKLKNEKNNLICYIINNQRKWLKNG